MAKRVNSREKGKKGELKAVHYLRSLGFSDARRTAQFNGKDGGKSDVVCEETLPNLHIEVKNGVRGMDLGTTLLDQAYAQSFRDSHGTGKSPVVLWRKCGGKTWRLTFGSKWGVTTIFRDCDISVALKTLQNATQKIMEVRHE